MARVTYKLEGQKDVIKAMEKLRKSLDDGELEPILEQEARTVADEMRKRVPVKSGNLKESIKSHLLPRKAGMPPGAVAKATASHAHLVEYGTASRTVNGKNVGAMPAKPFLRPAWDGLRSKVTRSVMSGIEKLLERGGADD